MTEIFYDKDFGEAARVVHAGLESLGIPKGSTISKKQFQKAILEGIRKRLNVSKKYAETWAKAQSLALKEFGCTNVCQLPKEKIFNHYKRANQMHEELLEWAREGTDEEQLKQIVYERLGLVDQDEELTLYEQILGKSS